MKVKVSNSGVVEITNPRFQVNGGQVPVSGNSVTVSATITQVMQ